MPVIAVTLLASSSSAFLKFAAAFAVSPAISCWLPRFEKNSDFFSGEPSVFGGGSSVPYGSFGPSTPLTPLPPFGLSFGGLSLGGLSFGVFGPPRSSGGGRWLGPSEPSGSI